MNKIFICLMILSLSSIIPFERMEVEKAFLILKTQRVFTNSAGESVKVNGFRKKCKGNDCNLFVNGKSIDPKLIIGNEATPKEIVKDTKEKEETVPKETETSTIKNASESGNMAGITAAHNRFRKLKNLPDLVWDETLAKYADEWAKNLQTTKNCGMKHRTEGKYGENLAWASGMILTPESVVKMWHDEEKNYTYSNNSCSGVCGHYTQVIWKNSKKVGCGSAKCGKAEVWVCNYDPPGNYVGQKPY
jgi:pathogenesis-related protein 1